MAKKKKKKKIRPEDRDYAQLDQRQPGKHFEHCEKTKKLILAVELPWLISIPQCKQGIVFYAK